MFLLALRQAVSRFAFTAHQFANESLLPGPVRDVALTAVGISAAKFRGTAAAPVVRGSQRSLL